MPPRSPKAGTFSSSLMKHVDIPDTPPVPKSPRSPRATRKISKMSFHDPWENVTNNGSGDKKKEK